MSVRPYRGWHFVQPGADAVAGIELSAGGGVAMIDGDDAVRQAILLLLATRPGERVMRPDYGTELHRLAFMPNDDTTAGLAIHYVARALSRWEPRIDVLAIDAGADAERPEILELRLDYRVRASQRPGQLVYPLSLSGGRDP